MVFSGNQDVRYEPLEWFLRRLLVHCVLSIVGDIRSRRDGSSSKAIEFELFKLMKPQTESSS